MILAFPARTQRARTVSLPRGDCAPPPLILPPIVFPRFIALFIMGGHKWIPQNRGLNVCTSGYGRCAAPPPLYERDPVPPCPMRVTFSLLVILWSSLIALVRALVSDSRLFFVLLLASLLCGAKAMNEPPSAVAVNGLTIALGAVGTGVAAIAAGHARNRRSGVPGIKGFARPTGAGASSPSAAPPAKQSRVFSPPREGAPLVGAPPPPRNALWQNFFRPRTALPPAPPSPSSRATTSGATPAAPQRAGLKHARPSPSFESPAPVHMRPSPAASPRLAMPVSSPAAATPRSSPSASNATARALQFGAPPVRALVTARRSTAPPPATPPTRTPTAPLAAVSALLCGEPLTLVTPSGTATLSIDHGNGAVWAFDDKARGELHNSTLLKWLAPFCAAPEMQPVLQDGARVKELLFIDTRPRRSVCLVVEGRQCGITVRLQAPRLSGLSGILDGYGGYRAVAPPHSCISNSSSRNCPKLHHHVRNQYSNISSRAILLFPTRC